jgi:glycerate-2-kinase
MYYLDSQMTLIKNFESLARTPERRAVLEVIEAGLTAISPEHYLPRSVWIDGGRLSVPEYHLNLDEFKNIRLLAFGKGSAAIAKVLERILGYRLTSGDAIDASSEIFEKIAFHQGSHPLPTADGIELTKKILSTLDSLSEKDLVIVVTCGGGSAMLELPGGLALEELTRVNELLLRSGASIGEMNTIRKHLSQVKGGGLAKILYPAVILNLVVSDVPGNDLSSVASGPVIKDKTTAAQAGELAKKYGLPQINFLETPKEDKYFKRVKSVPLLTNKKALDAMQEKAGELGFHSSIYSENLQGEAKSIGPEIIRSVQTKSILLAGGETTVTVSGGGQGGRNLELAAGALSSLDQSVTLASFDSDGWDNCPLAGAIVDFETTEKARQRGLDPNEFLDSNDTYNFFQKVDDGIDTGRLPSNVSDLMVVLRR